MPLEGRYKERETMKGLIRYYREHGERAKKRKDAIDEQKFRKLKLENDETEGRLTDTKELVNQVAPMLLKFRNDVYAALENEAPRGMAGMGVAEARIVGRRMAADLLLKLQHVFKTVR